MLPRDKQRKAEQGTPVEVKPAEPQQRDRERQRERSDLRGAEDGGDRKELKTEAKGGLIEEQVGDRGEESARKGEKERGGKHWNLHGREGRRSCFFGEEVI